MNMLRCGMLLVSFFIGTGFLGAAFGSASGRAGGSTRFGASSSAFSDSASVGGASGAAAGAGAGRRPSFSGPIPFGAGTTATFSTRGGASTVASVLPGDPSDGMSKEDLPAKGVLYYVPYSEREPFPWAAEKRSAIEEAVVESKLGRVPHQARNVFHVSDALATKLRREHKGAPCALYYVVEGDDSRTLMECPDQLSLRSAIKDAGCRRVPHHAANVFYVDKDDAAALLAVESRPMPLAYVVEGDPFETVVKERGLDENFFKKVGGIIGMEKFQRNFGGKENKGLIKIAIRASGSRHVLGHSEPNVFYVTKESAVELTRQVRESLEKMSEKTLYVIREGIPFRIAHARLDGTV